MFLVEVTNLTYFAVPFYSVRYEFHSRQYFTNFTDMLSGNKQQSTRRRRTKFMVKYTYQNLQILTIPIIKISGETELFNAPLTNI